MTLAPRVGWLLSYSYLWADDHRRGAEEGIKNRPCALVAATRRDGDRIVAIVTPVTHSPPADPADRNRDSGRDQGSSGPRRPALLDHLQRGERVRLAGTRPARGRRPQTADHLVRPTAAEARHGGARKTSWVRPGWAPSARAADRVSGAGAGQSRPTTHGVSSRDKAQSLPANQQRSDRAGRFQIRLRTVSRPPASKAARRRSTSSGSASNSPSAQTK